MVDSKKEDQKFEAAVRNVSPPKLITKTIILVYDVPTDIGVDIADAGDEEMGLLFLNLIDLEFLYPDGVVNDILVKVTDAAGNAAYDGGVVDIEPDDAFWDVVVLSQNPWPPAFQIELTFTTTY